MFQQIEGEVEPAYLRIAGAHQLYAARFKSGSLGQRSVSVIDDAAVISASASSSSAAAASLDARSLVYEAGECKGSAFQLVPLRSFIAI